MAETIRDLLVEEMQGGRRKENKTRAEADHVQVPPDRGYFYRRQAGVSIYSRVTSAFLSLRRQNSQAV